MSKITESDSLAKWLQNFDKEYYNSIEQASAVGLLMPDSGGNGITFLYPNDSELRSKITQQLNDYDPEGVQTLQSMIIPMTLSTTSEWTDMYDDIPNKLGFKLKVDIQKTNRSKVVLKNGASLTFLTSIDPKTSVWKYNGSNPIPVTGGDYSENKYIMAGASRPKIRRGGNDAPLANDAIAFDLARNCENQACLLIRNDGWGGRYFRKNPFLNALVSYLTYAKSEDPNDYIKSLKKLSYDPVASFYVIFQPYNSGGGVRSFNGWLSKTKGVNMHLSAVNAYYRFLEEAANNSATERLVAQKMREKHVLNALVPSILRSNLLSAYSEGVRGLDGIDVASKIREDELRFLIHERLYDTISSSSNPAAELKDLFFDIFVFQNGNGSFIITKDITVVNDMLDAAGFLCSVVFFALSDCFFYAPYKFEDKTMHAEISSRLGIGLSTINSHNINGTGIVQQPKLILTQARAVQYLSNLQNQQDEQYTFQSAVGVALEALSVGDSIGASLEAGVRHVYSLLPLISGGDVEEYPEDSADSADSAD